MACVSVQVSVYVPVCMPVFCVGGMRNSCVSDCRPIGPGQWRLSEPGTGMLGILSGLVGHGAG